MSLFLLRYGNIIKILEKFNGQESYIVNSVRIYEAPLTQKSHSNQAASAW